MQVIDLSSRYQILSKVKNKYGQAVSIDVEYGSI